MSIHINLSGQGPREVATEAFAYAVRSLRAAGVTNLSGSVGGYEDGDNWSVNASEVPDSPELPDAPEDETTVNGDVVADDGTVNDADVVSATSSYPDGSATADAGESPSLASDDGSPFGTGTDAPYDANDPDNPLNGA